MAECPGCLGEGRHDLRDEDAFLGEMMTDSQLERARAAGLVHPAGVTVCGECGGSGVVSEERAAEMAAAAHAEVSQLLARFNEHRRVVRVYWGCTTAGGCEYGFGGGETDFPRDVGVCPGCGGDLAEIVVSRTAPGLT